MNTVFVTATGTGVGKTFVSAALVRAARARGLRVRALKPVLSGTAGVDPAVSDAGELLSALGEAVDGAGLDRISPWRFAAPLSPDMAAAREGRSVPWDDLVAFSQPCAGASDLHLVEGVGGVMVPLDDRHTVLDWIGALDPQVVLVAGTYLGTLSHTLTALSVLTAAGTPASVIVLSESPDAPVDAGETRASLARFTEVPVHVLPRTDLGGAPGLIEPVLDRLLAGGAGRQASEPPS